MSTVETSGLEGAKTENTGRWTKAEHDLFLVGLKQHGKGWKQIASMISTRTVVQVRTHAQKYFQKVEKARAAGRSGPVIMDCRDSYSAAVPMRKRPGAVGSLSERKRKVPHASSRVTRFGGYSGGQPQKPMVMRPLEPHPRTGLGPPPLTNATAVHHCSPVRPLHLASEGKQVGRIAPLCLSGQNMAPRGTVALPMAMQKPVAQPQCTTKRKRRNVSPGFFDATDVGFQRTPQIPVQKSQLSHNIGTLSAPLLCDSGAIHPSAPKKAPMVVAPSEFLPDLFSDEGHDLGGVLELDSGLIESPVPRPLPTEVSARTFSTGAPPKRELPSDSQSIGVTDSEGVLSAPSSDCDLEEHVSANGIGNVKSPTSSFSTSALDVHVAVSVDDSDEILYPDDLPFLTDLQDLCYFD